MLRALLVAVVLGAAGTWPAAADADDPPQLRVDGKPVALPQGLGRTADGRTWITAGDLRHALGVVVRRLIPRPPEGRRRRPRQERDTWFLCSDERCSLYAGPLLGTSTDPTFELPRVVRALGRRLTSRRDVFDIQRLSRRGPPRKPGRAKVGALVPDVRLTFLDGTVRHLQAQRGKRLLIVTWAPWSTTRKELDTWSTALVDQLGHGLVLWYVALDVEGAARVTEYAAPAQGAPVALDRDALLPRVFPLQDVGGWFLIDELGVLRAQGSRFDESALRWIDLHLEEPRIERTPVKPAQPTRVALEILRARAHADPTAAAPRLALIDALGSDGRKEAIAHAAALVAATPKSAPYAFLLARLHIDAGDLASALDVLDAARRRSPSTWYLRKQYWALAEPNRYYAGPIDTAWEREQRRKEEKDFGRTRRR